MIKCITVAYPKKIKGGGWQEYTLDPCSWKMKINSLWETSCAMRERFCSVFFHCGGPFCPCGGVFLVLTDCLGLPDPYKKIL